MGIQTVRMACLVLLGAWGANVFGQDSGGAPSQAEPAEASAEAPRAGFSTGLGEWSLARRYPDQAVWLDMEDQGRALGLFLPEYVTPATGALLVLADEGQTADEGVLGPLRLALAERGVAVMTIGLGVPPEVVRRQRTNVAVPEPEPEAAAGQNSDSSGAPSDSTTIDVAEESSLDEIAVRFRNRVRDTLTAGYSELQRRGYERPSVLGIGWSADYVTGWAQDAAAVSAVVWLVPRFPAQRANALPSMFSQGAEGRQSWPVLDLQRSASAEGKARAAAFARAAVAGYERQPLALSQPLRDADAGRIASRISAWLGNRSSGPD
ncbi:DUF3530 family protein [Marinobacter sp. VGCF2001]|uniref:DUF3530 family protein n=1 Tax=Marinobacter sp. VGCF2001 TaxID=3417189 RepID=UPI003CF29481